jgi:hypothetical protein
MKGKTVIIVCRLDGYANSVRPIKIKEFLEKKKYTVEIYNTYNKNSSESILLKISRKILPKAIKQYLFYLLLKWNGRKLEKIMRQKRPDILICESEPDAYVLTKNLPCVTVYDCPTPFADELYYGGQMSKMIYALHRKMELKIYRHVDHLTFHWASYNAYVKKSYAGKNMFELNWGCTPKPKLAQYKSNPRVVYLGNLDGYWINLPLLSALSKMYPIDVYGGPPPDKKWGLNYCGYAHPDVLTKYQFGLITITKDELRRKGFSAKHLEYISYGLPVLCPDWRNDRRLTDVTIPFNEMNFVAQIHKYAEKGKWTAISKACVRKSKLYSWERQLRALDKIVANQDKEGAKNQGVIAC